MDVYVNISAWNMFCGIALTHEAKHGLDTLCFVT